MKTKLACILWLTAGVSGAREASPPPASGPLGCLDGPCRSTHRVQPIFFIPSNYKLDAKTEGWIVERMRELRSFFDRHAGATFDLQHPVKVQTRRPHDWYWCAEREADCEPNNFEANVIAELQRRGLPVHGDWARVPSDRIAWIVAFGGGGYAGGRRYPNGGGIAMLGDAGIYSAMDGSCRRLRDRYFAGEKKPVKDVCETDWHGKLYGFGVGALGHELGHALGLPHPDGHADAKREDWERTLMGSHWNYPRTGLLAQDVRLLADSPFFRRSGQGSSRRQKAAASP